MRHWTRHALLWLLALAMLAASAALAAEPPSPPTGVTASDLASPTEIDVTWNASDGATSYQVYRADTLTSDRALLAETAATTYVDGDVAPETPYYYWVTACDGDACSAPSEPDQGSIFPPRADRALTLFEHADMLGASHTFAEPGLYRIAEACPDLAGTVSSLDLTPGWSVRVWRYPDWNGPSADFDAWNRDLARETLTDSTSVDDAIQSIQLWHESPCPPKPETPPTPSNVRATDGDYVDKVRLSWEAVPGIDHYRIYRAAPGESDTPVHTTDDLSWDDGTVQPNVVYTYSVATCISGTYSIEPGVDTGYAGTLADAFEPDNDRESAGEIAAGQTQSRSIYPAGDVDWARFALDAPSQVEIATSGPAGDTLLYLYDAHGDLIAENDDDGGGRFSRIAATCDEPLDAGVYYLQVREYGSPDVIEAYALSLAVQPCQTPTPLPTLPPTIVAPTIVAPTLPPATLPAPVGGLWLPLVAKQPPR